MKKVHLGAWLILLACWGVHAQMPGGGPTGMTAAMSKMFGDIKGFSAKAEAQVLDSSQKEVVRMPMDFEFLDGKIRVHLDMDKIKSTTMPPGATEQLKKLGMAQVISIVRPDKSLAYVIYPDSKVLMSMPLPKDEESKIQKTALGKETVDGHSCVKNKVVIGDPKGQNVEAITWNASDLKDFPIQIQTKEGENTSIIRFSKVSLARPDTRMFEPPEGYKQYNSPQELMEGMMSRAQGQGEKNQGL